VKLSRETAEVFVPDGLGPEAALRRTTSLAVAAHQDDIEIMAAEGILQSFGRDDRWFTGIVVTDGARSPRSGLYRDTSDEQMREIRRREQKRAAVVGELAAVVLLDYPSTAVRSPSDPGPVADLVTLLHATRPEVVYTHNPADKHDTHVAVTMRLLAAIRQLPSDARPARVLGCEVWRDLDWLVDADKVAMDVSAREGLQAALLGVFDSQICGGKRYDLAALGRRRAHATYAGPHATDVATGINYAMDLTPLVVEPERDVASFVQEHVDRFAADVADRLGRVSDA
jgi:LmbE family N-acetylglucosaminyl deacetylase